MSHIENHLSAVVSFHTTPRVRDLARALDENRVIARAYRDAHGNGCLFNHLDPAIDSREKRIRTFGFDPQLLQASEETVRAWDLGILTPEMVKATLKRVLAQRARFEKEQAARRQHVPVA